MNNLLLAVDAGTIDWSRAQFALTAIYHWLFVPLTLGLAVDGYLPLAFCPADVGTGCLYGYHGDLLLSHE